MKVRVINRCFIDGQYRRRGDVFDCPASMFNERCLEKVGKAKNLPPLSDEGYKPLEIPSLINKDQ